MLQLRPCEVIRAESRATNQMPELTRLVIELLIDIRRLADAEPHIPGDKV